MATSHRRCHQPNFPMLVKKKYLFLTIALQPVNMVFVLFQSEEWIKSIRFLLPKFVPKKLRELIVFHFKCRAQSKRRFDYITGGVCVVFRSQPRSASGNSTRFPWKHERRGYNWRGGIQWWVQIMFRAKILSEKWLNFFKETPFGLVT